jgi:predicted nucleic acid-binding Zn finger protein
MDIRLRALKGVSRKLDKKWSVRPPPHPSTVKVFEMPMPTQLFNSFNSFIQNQAAEQSWSADYAAPERHIYAAAQIPANFFLPVRHFFRITLPKANLVKPGEDLILPQKRCLRVPSWQWNKTVEQLCADSERIDSYRARVAEDAILGNGGNGHPRIGDADRNRRGRDMSLDMRISQVDQTYWSVPSSTGRGTYTVNALMSICDCPDYQTRKKKCKHIYAVEVIQAAELNQRMQKVARFAKTYRMSELRLLFDWYRAK